MELSLLWKIDFLLIILDNRERLSMTCSQTPIQKFIRKNILNINNRIIKEIFTLKDNKKCLIMKKNKKFI